MLTAKDFLFLKSFLFKSENNLSQSYRDSLLKMWSKESIQDAIGAYYHAVLELDVNKDEFRQPCLQLWSSNDPFLGPSVKSAMHTQFPSHDVVEVESSSHWLQLEQPETVVQYIIDEIKKS